MYEISNVSESAPANDCALTYSYSIVDRKGAVLAVAENIVAALQKRRMLNGYAVERLSEDGKKTVMAVVKACDPDSLNEYEIIDGRRTRTKVSKAAKLSQSIRSREVKS